jgi:hypothetical protein
MFDDQDMSDIYRSVFDGELFFLKLLKNNVFKTQNITHYMTNIHNFIFVV